MILLLKTADSNTQVWLCDNAKSEPTLALEWESGRTLSEDLLGRLKALLEDSAKTFQDLTGIVIYSGPGSFTSLRIGHTVANALATSLKIPIAGAQGDNWLDYGCREIESMKIGVIAMPFYGAEAHITKPKG